MSVVRISEELNTIQSRTESISLEREGLLTDDQNIQTTPHDSHKTLKTIIMISTIAVVIIIIGGKIL